MQPRIYKIELDIRKANNIDYVEIVSGDKETNIFEITLMDGAEIYPVLDNIVTIVFRKSDKTEVMQSSLDEDMPIIVDEDVITCTLKTNTIAAQGRVLVEVRVSSLDGKVLTSQRFYFLVRKPLFSDDTIKSSDEFPLLEKILIDEIERTEKELIREQNEGVRLRLQAELKQIQSELQGWLDDPEQFRGPQGEQGIQGIKGDKGDKGDPGEVTQAEFDDLQGDFNQHKLEYVEQRQLTHFDHVKQEYINLDKFWDNIRNGKIYTVEFNQFNVSPVSAGAKKDDNRGLIMEPSTNTVKGRDDYSDIGLFKPIEVNAYVDKNDDYHVIAMQGDGRFKRDGTMGDVYIMNMTGYQKRFADDEVWGISYSDTGYGGFEILDEAVKPDGTIRPYLLHAKYVAGRNPHENNNLASISGVPAEYNNMSHNGQIIEFKKKGTQYSGKTSHDDYYVQLMMWLKYATLNSQSIMKGAEYYYSQYVNLVPEIGVKRVVITNSQANYLIVGSTVSIGDFGTGSISTDRQQVQNYNKAERVNITDIVDLGDGNSAIYVDSMATFDTTLTTTITTYPWNSGSCDNVLGTDGSPYSNTSGKEPFIMNKIEMMVGGYEVLQNLIIYNDNTDVNNYKIQVFACYDCAKYSTSQNENYDLVGYELVQTDQAWKYLSKVGIDPNHPSVLVPIEAEASSTTGFGDGIYTNTPITAVRLWRSLGRLGRGALPGLRCLYADYSLAYSSWSILGRLSATGRSRRRS